MMQQKIDTSAIEAIGRRKQRSWPKWAALGLAVALAAAGFWYWQGNGGGAAAVTYTTVPAAKADIVVKVTATGTIQPLNQVDISSELSGTVRAVNVDYNDMVKAGDVLAALDTDKLEASVSAAKAALSARQAGLAEAQATLAEKQDAFTRSEKLSGRGISSQESLQTARAALLRAEAAIETAKANVLAAEADLKLQETNLKKACICAPIDGIVLDRTVEPGQIVAASLQAPKLFTLAESLDSMELTVAIDEADIGQVEIGNEASFTVEAWQDRTFEAAITGLRYAPETVDGVVTYKAVLAVTNEDLSLRPGMTATADITVAERKGVLAVPNAALRYAPPRSAQGNTRTGLLGMIMPRPPGGQTATSNAANADGTRSLWVLRDGAPAEVKVKTGATDGEATEIAEGELKEGDAVITASAAAK